MAIKAKIELKRIDEEELTRFVLQTNTLPRDTPFTIYIADKKPIRTLPQNAYLWGVVYKTISGYTGYEKEEVHEYCKLKFALRTKFDLGDWGVDEISIGTKLMDTRQMTEYIDKIRRYFNERGMYIKAPNEIDVEDYVEAQPYK
jgi:hypothetical protein